MRHHHAGDALFRHNLLCQRQHLFRCGRVQRGGVFVQQKQLWRHQRCHQQCQCLTLAAAQQANRLAKPVFQAKAQRRKLLAERRAVFRTDGGEHAAPLCRAQVGQRHILFNGHVRGRAFQGVLKQAAYLPRAFVVRHKGDIAPVQHHTAFVRVKFTGHSGHQSGFSRPVRANQGDKIAFLQVKAHIVQRLFLIYSAGVERFADMHKVKHGRRPPFPLSAPCRACAARPRCASR